MISTVAIATRLGSEVVGCNKIVKFNNMMAMKEVEDLGRDYCLRELDLKCWVVIKCAV